MARHGSISRRSFLAAPAALPLAAAVASDKPIPVGLELYSVRDVLIKDLMGTVRDVAKIGYQVMEFYSPYYGWTIEYAREVRKLLDDLGVRCLSTHNGPDALSAAGLPKAVELNQALGAKYVVLASAGRLKTLDEWKGVAATLTTASETLERYGMHAGYHNHQLEFTPIDGKRPLEILAAGTPPQVLLQLDVGTCLEAGSDPVAWINANPGRIKCIHCKDWGRGEGKGYKVLIGEGDAPWAKIFEAAESAGGIEFYLIEQEGSRFPSLETAERCLANWKKLRG